MTNKTDPFAVRAVTMILIMSLDVAFLGRGNSPLNRRYRFALSLAAALALSTTRQFTERWSSNRLDILSYKRSISELLRTLSRFSMVK